MKGLGSEAKAFLQQTLVSRTDELMLGFRSILPPKKETKGGDGFERAGLVWGARAGSHRTGPHESFRGSKPRSWQQRQQEQMSWDVVENRPVRDEQY